MPSITMHISAFPRLTYYYYRKKRFRWRNVKRLQGHLTTLKTVTKHECDAKWEQSICQMRSSAELCSCHLLHAGGRSPSESSIITFSGSTVYTEVSDDQHRALLTYFLSLLMWDSTRSLYKQDSI